MWHTHSSPCESKATMRSRVSSPKALNRREIGRTSTFSAANRMNRLSIISGKLNMEMPKFDQDHPTHGHAGFTIGERAKRLGLSVPAAKSRVQRARVRLRTMFIDCCRVDFDARGAAPVGAREEGATTHDGSRAAADVQQP